MPRKQHIVSLSSADRAVLEGVLVRGRSSAQAHRRARILLATGPRPGVHRPTDREVASVVGVSARTVARVRADWARRGLACLEPPSHPMPHRLTPLQEARVIALACQTPPDGTARWTIRLLTQWVVELEIAEPVSRETIRRTLKKTTSNPGSAAVS